MYVYVNISVVEVPYLLKILRKFKVCRLSLFRYHVFIPPLSGLPQSHKHTLTLQDPFSVHSISDVFISLRRMLIHPFDCVLLTCVNSNYMTGRQVLMAVFLCCILYCHNDEI